MHQYTIIVLGGEMAESSTSGNYLVHVRAQVMTRDESTGLWVPIRGGGLSNVSVRKRPVINEDEAKNEYLIYGIRISDQTVVLSCTIKRDFEYNKVMPTFHHWRTGDKKFGLTFQTAADARAFDKGVKQAVEDLLDGLYGSSFLHASDVGEDDVFMTLELPVERVDSRSSSSSNGTNNSTFNCPHLDPPSTHPTSPFTHTHDNHHHLHRIHYIPRPQRTNQTDDDIWLKKDEPKPTKPYPITDDKIEIIPGEQSSYVQFARDPRPASHEYSYPVIDVVKTASARDKRPTPAPVVSGAAKPPLLPTKKRGNRRRDKKSSAGRERASCRHCHEMFGEDECGRGRCEFAPDPVRECVDAVTCIRCAQCMIYHCMADAEGDYAHRPCSCDTADPKCGRRWIGLVLLSLFVPCLCCYIPLVACHRCGAGCGVCGGRHEAT